MQAVAFYRCKKYILDEFIDFAPEEIKTSIKKLKKIHKSINKKIGKQISQSALNAIRERIFLSCPKTFFPKLNDFVSNKEIPTKSISKFMEIFCCSEYLELNKLHEEA